MKPKLWIWGGCHVPEIFMSNYVKSKNSIKNSNLALVGLLSTMLKPKLWIWGRCRVSQIFMSAHASFKNRSLFGLVSAYHSLFFPPHHNRKKNRRQCKDMDNCLVQFVPFKNILNNALDNFWWSRVPTTNFITGNSEFSWVF